LTSKIVLVPFDGVAPDGADPNDVAFALSRQVIRDVQPAWHVSADVHYVENLDAVPEDCVPLVIIEDDEQVPGHGFHFDIAGRPCALIRNTPGRWPQFASHELIELLVDPTGALAALGPTLDRKIRPQTVNYLIEVCDPVEESTYYGDREILLSDFVYPAYYFEDKDAKRGMQFSHCDTIPAPRKLLTGGYLSWQTLDTGKVFQAFGGPERADVMKSSRDIPSGPNKPELWAGDPWIKELRPGADVARTRSRIDRHWVGINGMREQARRAAANEQTMASSSASAEKSARRSHVQALREDIQTFTDLVSGRRRPPVSLEVLIRALEAAKQGGPVPYTDLGKKGVTDQVPDSKQKPEIILDDVIQALRNQEKISRLFGEGLFGSGISSWVLYLIP
jgi:hypothetical protein